MLLDQYAIVFLHVVEETCHLPCLLVEPDQ